MAVATQDKSRGLSFAEQQLLRHGWEQGKGLGKNENGISEAIKVKVKCDKGGVGHKQSEQFTFHWWDHVFNKASSCLDVESGQDGVVVKKREGEEEEGMISNKKPRKAMLNKSNLYGCFVKSATLLSGKEQPERRLSSSEDSSSSDDDDDKLDLSSTTKLSDDALMKACGGRTAHKGARHGFTMSAKLARLEQQEQEFMAKYGKKEQTAKTASQCGDASYSSVAKSELDQETAVNTKHKKPKKKKKQSTDELSENPAQEDDINIDAPQIHHNKETSKKQKKRSKEQPSDTPDASVDNEVVNTEKKKKRKRKHLEKDVSPEEGVSGSNELDENSTETAQQCEEAAAAEVDETAAHQLTGDDVCKKEKRKKKKRSEKMSGLNEGSAVSSEDSTEAKESHGQEQQEEGSVVLQPACESVPKKKKKKYSEPSREESLSTELETHHSLETTTEDLSTKKKKNKKKRKQEK